MSAIVCKSAWIEIAHRMPESKRMTARRIHGHSLKITVYGHDVGDLDEFGGAVARVAGYLDHTYLNEDWPVIYPPTLESIAAWFFHTFKETFVYRVVKVRVARPSRDEHADFPGWAP